jgi:hypothetical protein
MEKIIVTVQGGLVQAIERIPAGVEIEVRDFDTDEGPEEDDRVQMIGGHRALVSIWNAKPRYEVIVQAVQLYRGFVLAESVEEVKRMMESGEARVDEEYGDPETTLGEIRDVDGRTVWERP